jgi:hypothetical protein
VILRQTIAIPALAALALAAVAGCGSSGSNSASSTGSPAASASASGSAAAAGGGGSNVGLSDSALRAAFTNATKGASAMHINGTLSQQGQSVYMDLVLNKDNTSEGTIAIGNAKLPVRAVAGVDYIQLTSSFLQLISQQENVPAAELTPVANKWITSNSAQGKSIASGFDQFMTFSALTSTITSDNSDPAIAAGTTMLNGQSVAYYTTKKGSKLYFPANGPAYLLREDDSSSDGTGTITIVWNKPEKVTAPSASEIATLPGA